MATQNDRLPQIDVVVIEKEQAEKLRRLNIQTGDGYTVDALTHFERWRVFPYGVNEVEIETSHGTYLVTLALADAIDSMITRARRLGYFVRGFPRP